MVRVFWEYGEYVKFTGEGLVFVDMGLVGSRVGGYFRKK